MIPRQRRPRAALTVESVGGSQWIAALEPLQSGAAAVGLGGLTLSCDPASAKAAPRLHIEFACPFDPMLTSGQRQPATEARANEELARARAVIDTACGVDASFEALVADSGVVYECVHRYGTGTLLVATARREGPLVWKK